MAYYPLSFQGKVFFFIGKKSIAASLNRWIRMVMDIGHFHYVIDGIGDSEGSKRLHYAPDEPKLPVRDADGYEKKCLDLINRYPEKFYETEALQMMRDLEAIFREHIPVIDHRIEFKELKASENMCAQDFKKWLIRQELMKRELLLSLGKNEFYTSIPEGHYAICLELVYPLSPPFSWMTNEFASFGYPLLLADFPYGVKVRRNIFRKVLFFYQDLHDMEWRYEWIKDGVEAMPSLLCRHPAGKLIELEYMGTRHIFNPFYRIRPMPGNQFYVYKDYPGSPIYVPRPDDLKIRISWNSGKESMRIRFNKYPGTEIIEWLKDRGYRYGFGIRQTWYKPRSPAEWEDLCSRFPDAEIEEATPNPKEECHESTGAPEDPGPPVREFEERNDLEKMSEMP